ncbi:MAG TPA: hypothetical protein HPP56_06810 [Nitrospirae bacterium]|nr:hypothetical protein [Nitrospirota bacterium]
MSEIGLVAIGTQAIQLNTQIIINTELIKKSIEADQQMAKLLSNLANSVIASSSSGIDLYV